MFEQAPTLGPGTGTLTEHALDIGLLLLGAWLLGWLFGYLLNAKHRRRAAALETELQTWKTKQQQTEQQLISQRYQHDELRKTHNLLSSDLRHSEAERIILEGKLQRLENREEDLAGAVLDATPARRPPEVRAADSGIGAAFERSNLQIFEGIGPKVEAVLHDGGIATWEALADQTAERLTPLLTGAGIHPNANAPDSWPRQAELAARGDWTALIELQKFVSGHVRGGGTAKVEKMHTRQSGGGDVKRNDLQVVTGIDGRIAEVLQQAGVRTWKELGQSQPQQLRQILIDAGVDPRHHRPDTWPRQAQLADAANWRDLEALQRTLHA